MQVDTVPAENECLVGGDHSRPRAGAGPGQDVCPSTVVYKGFGHRAHGQADRDRPKGWWGSVAEHEG